MNRFFQGMMYLIMGLRTLSTKGLKRFIILPIAFNLLLFSGLFYLIYYYLSPYTYYYLDKLPSWLGFLSWVFFVLFAISFLVVFFLMFTVMFNIVAAPFNGLLAEKTQKLLYNSAIPSLSFTQIALRSIKRQGQFLGYFLPRLVIIGILFFIPFIHPVYPIIWFVFAAWMLGMQYQDFAMDNNLIGFQEMREKIKNNKMQSLGFGSLINIISFIPLLNILTMPAAVIGSVIMYCEENKIKSEPPLLIKTQ